MNTEKELKLTAKEIRIELHKFENKLRKHRGINKLVDKYLTKVTYMQMWLRLIPIDKKVLSNWHMPDYNDVAKLNKELE